MFDWQATRKAARQVVHDTFAGPADYVPVGGGMPTPVNIRVHRAGEWVGEPDGLQGGAVYEELTAVIIDTAELATVARGDTFTLPGGEVLTAEGCDKPRDGKRRVWVT